VDRQSARLLKFVCGQVRRARFYQAKNLKTVQIPKGFASKVETALGHSQYRIQQ
jgi:hypothetical protein